MTTQTPEAANRRPRRSRGLMLALFASLALNLLFIGGLISAFWRHGGALGAQPNGQINLGSYVQTLPRDRGGAIWRSTAEKRRQIMPLRQQVRQARREVFNMLGADPFDHEAFRAAQTRLVEAEHRQRLVQRDILVDIASSMTAEERRAFIRWRGAPRSGPAAVEDDEPAAPKKQ